MVKIIVAVLFTLMALAPAFATDKTFTGQLDSIKTELAEMPEMPNSKYISTYDLKDLLRDSNPEIRKVAVKNSKTIISNSGIYRLIIDIFESNSERLDIRIEAARALSYGTGESRITDALSYAVKYENDPTVLKIMTYKSLWHAASTRSATQSFLVGALKYDEKDSKIRKAVIWSLFAASRNSRVSDTLLDLLKYGNDDNATKIEAIKSLYLAMGQSSVKSQMMDIVKYKTSPADTELRKTAILALSAANGDSRVESLLEDLIKYDKDTEIREVALEAMVQDQFKMNEFFHLNYALGNGSVFNPIENE
ncbi:MAG: HEAT repeat domain-containing protein [Elusimicrobia bacterium]|nr:HEAT repeat domain-containing protein [Elusimicrobiota bacterium]